MAAKPLFHDPVFDGAADPTVIWNKKEKLWFMFYTNRRATAPGETAVAALLGALVVFASWGSRVAALSQDGRTVTLQIPQIKPTWCMEIKYWLKGAGGEPVSGTIHNTIHRLQPGNAEQE